MVHHSEGCGYIYTITPYNELIKIKSEYAPVFLITVLSSRHFEE